MTAADGLSGRQVETLIDALIAGYPAHEELEMLLYIELEKRSLLAIAGTGGLRSCVFRLVRAADSEGWLPELIIAAVRTTSAMCRAESLDRGRRSRSRAGHDRGRPDLAGAI